jgi:hypothetical protein
MHQRSESAIFICGLSKAKQYTTNELSQQHFMSRKGRQSAQKVASVEQNECELPAE